MLQEARSEKWKPVFSLVLASAKAKNFLEAILPYLRIKKEQAEIAIEFQKRKKPGNYLTEDQVKRDHVDLEKISSLKRVNFA